MPSYEFTDITGKRWRCLYPEGRDPLLAAWRGGEYGTHHTWTDPDFWREVARLAAQAKHAMTAHRAKKNARTS